nr:putative gustatory receptor 28a [Onthophagus taurus]
MFNFKCNGTLEDYYILLRLAYSLGLTPIVNVTTPKLGKFYKYYASLLLLLILIGAGISFSGRILNVYPIFPVTITLVDGMSLIVLTLTNVVSIYNLSINRVGTNLMVDFFEGMSCVDTKLHKYCKKIDLKRYYIELIIGHIFIIIFYIYDGYVWIKYLGIYRFKAYICRSIQNYINFITMFMIRYYVLTIKLRFHGLNVYIQEYAKQILSSPVHIVHQHCFDEEFASCKRPISHIYNALCDQINVFNKLYGLPTLLLSLYFISELLVSLMLSIIYYFQRHQHMDGFHFGVDLFWLCFFWIIKDFVSYLKIIAPCDGTIGEVKQIPIVCYKLLHEISDKSTLNYREKCLRSELTLIALQSSTIIPNFSAAGFFNIDFTTFFTLMGFVTSYLVVLIQFNGN